MVVEFCLLKQALAESKSWFLSNSVGRFIWRRHYGWSVVIFGSLQILIRFYYNEYGGLLQDHALHFFEHLICALKNDMCLTVAVAAQNAKFRCRASIVHVQSSDTRETQYDPQHRLMSRKHGLQWHWKCVHRISSLSVVYKQFTAS